MNKRFNLRMHRMAYSLLNEYVHKVIDLFDLLYCMQV